MNDEKVSRMLSVNNPQGIHARPAHLIVRRLQPFQAKVEFVKENQRVDGRSILELLTLAAEQGTQLVIEANGPDARQALDAVAELFAANFAEPEGQTEQAEKIEEPKSKE
jgi:phosphotransferase system HPr (HPr) family protein